MSPILGIYASQVSGHLWPASSYESIATVNVGAGGASSSSFTSIPSTYKHLQIRWISRSSGAGYNPNVQFNSDTAANYAWHYIDGNGASATAGGAANTSSITLPGIQNNANTFATGIIDILDYADTNKFKTFRTLQGCDYNGSGAIDLWSGLWRSTTAISTINLNFFSAQYSQFALYGIKVAS
jgi:hypothetical protein